MIETTHETLSVRRQCELLGVTRSSLYYQPVGVREEDLAVMRRLDEIYLEDPTLGTGKLAKALRREGLVVGRAGCDGSDARWGC